MKLFIKINYLNVAAAYGKGAFARSAQQGVSKVTFSKKKKRGDPHSKKTIRKVEIFDTIRKINAESCHKSAPTYRPIVKTSRRPTFLHRSCTFGPRCTRAILCTVCSRCVISKIMNEKWKRTVDNDWRRRKWEFVFVILKAND